MSEKKEINKKLAQRFNLKEQSKYVFRCKGCRLEDTFNPYICAECKTKDYNNFKPKVKEEIKEDSEVRKMIRTIAQEESEYYDKYGYFSFWSDNLKVQRIKEQIKNRIEKWLKQRRKYFGWDFIKYLELYEKLSLFYSKRIKEILNLKIGWNGYNSKGYKENTIINTILFLSKLFYEFQIKYQKELPKPYLFPIEEGSLNIEWKNDEFELLITIPESLTELAGLYGINSMKNEIKYDFRIFKIKESLLSWLKESIIIKDNNENL